MKNSDFYYFSSDEITTMLVDLINQMEKEGGESLKNGINSNDILIAAYGAALLTKVNMIEEIVKQRKGHQIKKPYEDKRFAGC